MTGINSSLDTAEEKVNIFEAVTIETIQKETQRGKSWEKNLTEPQ